MKECNLPTPKQCSEIMKEYRAPLHILKHSLTVAGLAVFLAKKLKEKGQAVNVALVERACLLHDIMRVCDFEELDYGKFQQTITEEDKAKIRQIGIDLWDEVAAKSPRCQELVDIVKAQARDLGKID